MSEISVVVVGSTSINSVVGNGDTVNVNVGDQTVGGGNGQAATIQAGTVTTIDATQTATVTNVGTAYAAKFNFSLPRGNTGSAGPATSLSVGSVSTGTTAAVSISGSAPSQSLSFVLQPGPSGPATSLSIGSVSTGTTAAVSVTGTAPSQSLSFVLPQGPVGPATSLSVGSVSTGTTAAVSISGSAPSQLLSFVLQPGPTGSTGPANSLSIGSVTTGATAAVSISGSAPSQSLSFVLQPGLTGSTGPANSLSIGSVTTGTTAAVSISGSAPSQALSFVLPAGPQGPQGPAGPPINLADETPQPLGAASAGTALAAARADHIHSQGSIAYSGLSGIPSSFTPSAHTQAISTVVGLQDALNGKQVAGSYAPLVNSLIPSSYLPSYVDDVVDVGGTLPSTGDVGKIYVVSTGANTNKIYRWSGSTFIEISPSPGSTDSVTEGSTNLYHTNTRAAAAAPVQSVAGRTGTITLTSSDVGLGNVTNTDATARSNHTGTQLASTISNFATEAAKYGPVTSVSTRTGDVVISTSDVEGLAALLADVQVDVIDGGDYVGVVPSPTITITAQPANYAATLNVGSTWSQTGYGATNWRAAASNGSRFVVAGVWYNSPVGYYTSTSTDATTWTTRGTSASPQFPVAALASDGTSFVAVGNLKFAGSTDGLTWTDGTLPVNANAIAYGNSRWLAAGSSSSTSTNGTTWATAVTAPAAISWLCYGSGGFVGVAAGTTASVYRTTDGTSWSTHSLPASAAWSGVAFGGGVYVAVRTGSTAAYSSDGQTWTTATMPSSRTWYSPVYAGGRFWAFGYGTTSAAYSTDGQTWTAVTLPATGNWVSSAGTTNSVLAINAATGSHAYSAASSSASFAVGAASTGALSYQWQISTDSGATFANVSGQTSETISLSSLVSGDSGKRYRCIVSATGASSVTSNSATLTVT